MKLRSLRIHGFKSFADKTEILFHDGLTAIVGPNGCGKSNISDAVRWVLGEQRPTAIRGAKMEEAIFQGTANRRPVNRGSVAIEVTNESGVLPVPFREVEIARTIYRDGGSDYSLNRSNCRLRDIQDLCRDTGLGANAYAVIENRMIDTILSDRADERRGLFEEAAGIGKYKDRRRAAARRLERAEIDIQRLADVIGEVQVKVRSLARQKGKAQRYRDLLDRRLDLEISLAQSQLRELEDELKEVRVRRDAGFARGEGVGARISAAEARQESLRIELLNAQRVRSEVAGRADAVKGELVRWEREIAVAEERYVHGFGRLRRIDEQQEESRSRAGECADSESQLRDRKNQLKRKVEGIREDEAELGRRVGNVRSLLEQAHTVVEDVEVRERELARRLSKVQGDAEAGEVRTAEIEIRTRHFAEELALAESTLAEARSQGDLFTDRLVSLSDEILAWRSRMGEVTEAVSRARDGLRSARDEERRTQDLHSELTARQSALERMENDREGVDPVVRSVLSRDIDGVFGLLADFLHPEPDVSAAVELILGVLLRAVVVRDLDMAMGLANWFREEWDGKGGLILLPLDQVPEVTGRGTLLDRVKVSGIGAPWARALLEGIELTGSNELALTTTGISALNHVTPDGMWVDQRGIFRLGNPSGSTGLLERKNQLRALRGEVANSAQKLAVAREIRDGAERALAELEKELETSRETLRSFEDDHREARAQAVERSDHLSRMERIVEELTGQVTAGRAAHDSMHERVRTALRELESLGGTEHELERERADAQARLDKVRAEWDEVRLHESRLALDRTRWEGELNSLEERIGDLVRIRETALARIESLEQERTELGEQVAKATALQEEGKMALEALFERQTAAEVELETSDRVVADLTEVLVAAEREVRDARAAEREAAEERHLLELQGQELASRMERVRDRMEAEWRRPFDELVGEASPVEGPDEELRRELHDLITALDRLGPVNMLAVEEHEEESARLAFLSEQRDDLVEARNDLTGAIKEINATATRLFSETFEAIRENFRNTFHHLFEGGECDLWLENPADPLESDVEIHAAPKGKRTQRIELLSGGERALTALSLLFGIYLVKPSPFCVLDEVDAPLDEANIGRFIRLLHQFKSKTQFVVITHNPRTIEAADWIYGVTMEEPGVSRIVGVRLDEALEVAKV